MNSLKSLLADPVLDLRRVNNEIPKIVKHPKLQKKLLKLMTKVWSEDEDTRRVLAFLNILKALRYKFDCFGLCIKLLFAAFVKNTKFVHGSTIAQVNFMRNSLIELFGHNLDDSYLHGFAYIRQLAITLRKAYTSHTKDDMHSVNNWQYICSLQLWTEFVATYSEKNDLIQSLVHPLVQLIVGTLKLSGDERWIPLRFQCISMLHLLAGVPVYQPPDPDTQKSTIVDCPSFPLRGKALSPANRVFVPSLPLLLDVFRLVNFNRRAATASKTPMDLRLLLHFSPSQRRETASTDAVINWLFDLLGECMAIYANSVCFPEYSLPLINELKRFIRTCRVASFTRQMKALLTKTQEHADWILKYRNRLRNLANKDEILNLESAITVADEADKLLPFWQFYLKHKQIRLAELNRLAESHKKEALPSSPNADDLKHKQTRDRANVNDEWDTESESSNSDASYDYDDGTTITHVSKSKARKKSEQSTKVFRGTSSTQKEESEDSDFDLEAALKDEEDMKSVLSDAGADELTDFELESSDNEDHVFESSSYTGKDQADSVKHMTKKQNKSKKKSTANESAYKNTVARKCRFPTSRGKGQNKQTKISNKQPHCTH